jgi:hypothetical protein
MFYRRCRHTVFKKIQRHRRLRFKFLAMSATALKGTVQNGDFVHFGSGILIHIGTKRLGDLDSTKGRRMDTRRSYIPQNDLAYFFLLTKFFVSLTITPSFFSFFVWFCF